MARSLYRFAEADPPHPLTCTVVEWLPISEHPQRPGQARVRGRARALALVNLSVLCGAAGAVPVFGD